MSTLVNQTLNSEKEGVAGIYIIFPYNYTKQVVRLARTAPDKAVMRT